MLKRLFVSVLLPAKLRKQFMDYMSALPETKDLRIPDISTLHITVCFVGNVEEKEVPNVKKCLKESLKDAHRFHLALGKIVFAPLAGEQSMIWATFSGKGDFKKLAKEVCGNLDVNNKNALVPHVTLARFNRPEIAQELTLKRHGIKDGLEVSSLELIESQLRPSGPKYEVVGSYKLKA